MNSISPTRGLSRQMEIKLGDVTDPRTVWAYPAYEQGGQHDRILRLEKEIAEYSEGQSVNEHTQLGTLVAVRRNSHSEIWHRGKLKAVSLYGEQLMAKLFLIDYGEVWEQVKVKGCLKLMPPGASEEPPMAFEVVLAGLQPVSMDLDFMLGQNSMEVTPQVTWDQSAMYEVENEIKRHEKYASLKDWTTDRRGRCHGQLHLGGTLHLNQHLIDKKFAIHSQCQYKNDMDEILLGNDVSILPKTDSVKVFAVEESCQFDSINDVSITTLEEATELLGINKPPKVVSQWTRFVSNTSIGRGRSVNENLPIGKEDEVQFKKDSVSETVRVEQANKLLARLRARNVSDTGSSSEDTWSCLRSQSTSENKHEYKVPVHMLPGGALIGKHHEEILSHLPSCTSFTDQKRKFMRYLKPQSRR